MSPSAFWARTERRLEQATLPSVTHRRSHRLIIGALAVSLAGATAVSATARSGAVVVHVQRGLNVLGNVHVSFHPTHGLPQGGYYYAVIVLKPYRHYTQKAPPPCATSSNMERTDYGYPHTGHPVSLALTPAKSHTWHWCRGGVYAGAIYAVPHAPPCESTYPCRSEPYERSPCFEVAPGHRACGVVAQPKLYAYPGGPPAPIASGARIIARFAVRF
jgi:hypothetical protein